ncbi:hypothetical protein NDU88_005253 [Pleurodeles waltl]|uniref:Uncharacterized protein n=1 Tax=Pleurodeles waltl TaxID=8319 RepID=A0AAV7M9V4_PLEWA|nr:hypothetical protein NDU88_005253 [Pleurodeles waltl]
MSLRARMQRRVKLTSMPAGGEAVRSASAGGWLAVRGRETADPSRRGDRPAEHRERGAERKCEAQRWVAAPPEDTGTPLQQGQPRDDS